MQIKTSRTRWYTLLVQSNSRSEMRKICTVDIKTPTTYKKDIRQAIRNNFRIFFVGINSIPVTARMNNAFFWCKPFLIRDTSNISSSTREGNSGQTHMQQQLGFEQFLTLSFQNISCSASAGTDKIVLLPNCPSNYLFNNV